jgi:hypothetical protein
MPTLVRYSSFTGSPLASAVATCTTPINYSATNTSTALIDPMLDYDRYFFMQYTQRF